MLSIVTLVVSVFVIWFGFPNEISLADTTKATNIGTALSSVAATMLGFMLAALSILASISGMDFVKRLMSSGHYKELLITLFIGCFEILVLLIMSLILLFGTSFNEFATTVYISLLISCLALLIELGRKFWLLLNTLTNNDYDSADSEQS